MRTTPLDHLPSDFSIEKLTANMTPEEIAAMNAGDDPIFTDQGIVTELAEIVTHPPEVTVQQPVAQPAPVAAPVTPAALDPAPAQTIQVPVLAQVPDTAPAKVVTDAYDAKMDAIAERYESGDIDKAQMRAELAELNKSQTEAQALIERAAAIEADNVAKQTQMQQDITAQWYGKLDAYKAVAPELWSSEHLAGWDAALKAVTSSPASASMTLDQCIERAHQVYRMNYTAQTGNALPAPAKTQAAPAANPGGLAPPRTDPRPALQTLATVSGQTSDETVNGTYAMIDKAIAEAPDQAEELFMRMTPAQREHYINSAQ